MAMLRNFATVGGGTMVSRVLGFLRDMLMAAAVGTGPVADAFFVAFRFPNMFRRVFAEGAFNAAFVPLFAKALEGDGARGARQFAEEALAALVMVLLILTAIAELAMPLLMYVLAPGFADDPEKFDLAILLTRIAFPYLLFVSVLALLSGVLNALGKFAAAAFASALLNVILIGVLAAIVLTGNAQSHTAGIWLSWGVFAGGAAQLLMLVIAARRSGMGLRLVRPRMTPGVRRLLSLGLPGVIAGGITQINLMVGTMIASLQNGAVSFLYYADRIYQLPLGIVGIAIGVVLLPDLSRRLKAGDVDGVHAAQNRALEFALALTVPAALALAAIAAPIVRGLFERGAFDAADTSATAAVLMAFSAGLPAFVLIKVFSPAFFAREDTRTPMHFAAINVSVNIALSLAMFPFLGHVGIAIATSTAAWVNTALLANWLWKSGDFTFDARLRKRAVLTVHAGLWMMAALLAADYWVSPLLGDGTTAGNILVMVMLVALGGLVYAVVALATGVITRGELRSAFSRGGADPA